MAWMEERITDDGDKRFVACFSNPGAANAPPAPIPPTLSP